MSRNCRAAFFLLDNRSLIAQKGGVLVRAGHTEAGSDLAQLAHLEPAAVICEVLNEDGSMARLPNLLVFAEEHGLKIGAIRDLIEYRAATEHLITRLDARGVAVPQRFGRQCPWRQHFGRSRGSGRQQLPGQLPGQFPGRRR